MAAAVFADLDVDVEHSPEALHPCHGAVPLCGTLVTPVSIATFRFVGPLAPLSRRHLHAVFTVWREDAMETCEVDSWLGYQRGQFGNEVQRLKDHMGRAIAIGCLQFVTHLAIGRHC